MMVHPYACDGGDVPRRVGLAFRRPNSHSGKGTSEALGSCFISDLAMHRLISQGHALPYPAGPCWLTFGTVEITTAWAL